MNSAIMSVVRFEAEDVIATSGGPELWNMGVMYQGANSRLNYTTNGIFMFNDTTNIASIREQGVTATYAGLDAAGKAEVGANSANGVFTYGTGSGKNTVDAWYFHYDNGNYAMCDGTHRAQ